MKKKNEKVTSNDVLDALSIRLNDLLKTGKKGSVERKNSSYFWLFKLIFVVLYILLIVIIFDVTRDFGVALIYAFGKSLRSVLSLGWILILAFLKGILILYVVFNNLVDFMESDYYKKLYINDKPLFMRKNAIFGTIKTILQGFSIGFLLIVGFSSAVALFVAILFIKLLLDGVYIVSPIIICLAVFAICYLAFKHIQNKFFNTKPVISNSAFLFAVIILVIGVAFFGYETSGYEYKNGLPLGFETIKQTKLFDVSRTDKIVIKSNTKLDNLKVYIDDTLVDEIRVELEYYDTAEVSYIYTFNKTDDLYLTFTSDLKFDFEDLYDVAKLASATFSNNTVYNYNLFKYPNIRVYANERVAKKITTQHN